jgi:hypothetical protein
MLFAVVLCLCAWAASESDATIAPSSARSVAPAVGGTDAITIPQMLSYQGKMTDTFGLPVVDTTYQVTFRLYTVPSGGSSFWDETQTVRTRGGLFSTLLGSVTPVGSMPDAGAVYLSMAVAGGSEMTPRLRLASSAYAYSSERAANSDQLQGRDTTTFSRSTHNHDATYVNEGQADAVASSMIVNGTVAAADLNQMGAGTGQVMKWTGSAWAPRNDSVGQGGTADNAWVRGTPDSVLYTVRQLGIARGGSANMLYGNLRQTHTNLGVACTTGTSGQNYGYATVGGGYTNTASQDYATVSGGYLGVASGSWSTVGGGYLGTASGSSSTVGGGYASTASGYIATVGGGWGNAASGYIATLAGGRGNQAGGDYSTVAGGMNDSAKAACGGVLSGYSNLAGDAAEDTAACVAGGYNNSATAKFATVSGGYDNTASGYAATVGGGTANTASGMRAVVGGGHNNLATNRTATVGGGEANSATGLAATVAGGFGNIAGSTYSMVGGGTGDTAYGFCSSAAGSGVRTRGTANYTFAFGEDCSTSTARAVVFYHSGAPTKLGVGVQNPVWNMDVSGKGKFTGKLQAAAGFKADTSVADSQWATKGYVDVHSGGDNAWVRGTPDSVLFTIRQLGIARGGAGNMLHGNQRKTHTNLGVACTTGTSGQDYPYATVSGGYQNTAAADFATVGGGGYSLASGSSATVGGGYQNTAAAGSATVGGGWNNTASGSSATVGGGHDNTASALNATVGGGYGNAASNFNTTVAGGLYDTSAALYSFTTNSNSVVPDGFDNSAAFNGQRATSTSQTRVGVLSKASGTFTIDHPVDPAGKILNHYFIEGPEMLNIYRGSVVLDASGRAEVQLPDYFDALNRNPMVQLTGVGGPDVVYVAEDVSGNRFVIGGKPGTKVYWQVTGERQDVSAEITRRLMPVEQPKTGVLAGTMLDDDFLRGTMDQLVREGKTQGIDFRTAAGRQRYEKMKQSAEQR